MYAGKCAGTAIRRSSASTGRSVGGRRSIRRGDAGFGTALLEKVVAVQCDADVGLHYDRDGFHFTMELPLRNTRLVPAYT